MKLYSIPHSPYGARVSALIRLKQLPVEVLPPPEALRTDGFFKRFPLGKVPILELDDGSCLGESWAILEYLEEAFTSSRSLSPKNALERARMRELARYADLHLAQNALFPLFRSALAGQSIGEDTEAALRAELVKGERLIGARGPIAGRRLDLGDIALAPSILYLEILTGGVGESTLLGEFPAFSGWWREIWNIPELAEVLKGVAAAFEAFAGAKASA